jgi:hypothetical protein
MCYDCGCEEYYDDYIPLGNNMTRKEDYVVEGGHYYATLDEAIEAAKKRVHKTSEDHKVYKAVKLVSTTTPNTVVTDVNPA